MGDDDLAWDDDEYEVPAVAKTEAPVTKLAEEEEEEEAAPAAKSGGARKAGGKAASGKGAAASSSAAAAEEAGPLDPLAEKFRLQRLQEASDFEAARAAFGGAGQNLDELCPKTESDFTEYGDVLYFKYLRPFEKNGNFKAALKTMLRTAANALSTHEMKELESCIIAVRNTKLKEEKDAQTKAKKPSGKVKPTLKAGPAEGDLDDARYQTTSLDDEYDFM